MNLHKTQTTLFTLDMHEHHTKTTDSKHTSQHNQPQQNPRVTLDTHYTHLHVHEVHSCLHKSTKTSKTLSILQALTAPSWVKQKQTTTDTYKAITRPIVEYAKYGLCGIWTIWSPTISQTNTDKLQTIQDKALRIATGCIQDNNTQHLHEENHIIPVKEHLTLHTTQFLHKTREPTHAADSANKHIP